MRLVVDTNVIVSGLLNRSGKPGALVDLILDGKLIVVRSVVIVSEYRTVLLRKKFQFDEDIVSNFIAAVSTGELVAPSAVSPMSLRDPTDWPFLAAALEAKCPIVTGNTKHFLRSSGVEILSPAQALERVASNP